MGDLGGIRLIDVSELNSAAVRAVFEYWQGKCAPGALPASRTLDPLEMPRLLPHLLLKDVQRDPWDFRYRVVGTLVREHSRHDWTGKWMSEIDGQGPGSILFRVTQWVAEEARPAIYRPPYVGPHKEFKHCEAALMPWVDAGGQTDRVLVAADFLMS
jgi:hypothetical protein